MDDLSHPEHSAKEKRFLLSELKTIKEQLHQKLLQFKARTQGRIGPASQANAAADNIQFDISEQTSLEDILRSEIDHFFLMTQLLNTIVLKGDEAYRTMQELAKLTNEQDQISLEQLVKRLQQKFQLLLDETQNLSTEKELKLIPRIEQLLRENDSLRGNNAVEGQDVDGLLVQNEYLQDQVNQLKTLQKSSYKSREERADLLL